MMKSERALLSSSLVSAEHNRGLLLEFKRILAHSELLRIFCLTIMSSITSFEVVS